MQLARSLGEILFTGDVGAIKHERVLWPVSFIAIVSGTPARTKFLTAVLLKSCGIRPGLWLVKVVLDLKGSEYQRYGVFRKIQEFGRLSTNASIESRPTA